MTIDWTKLDTAEMKSARIAEQNAKAAERAAVEVLRTAAKADPVFAQVKNLKPEEYDNFINCNFPRMMTAQRAVMKFLLQVATIVLRDS